MKPHAGLTALTVPDPNSGGIRQVWVEERDGGRLCLFLDGEFYLERMDTRGTLASLRAEGFLRDVRCAFVSYGSMEARHVDYTCSRGYNQFLADVFLPAIFRRGASAQPHIIVGLSLSGLAAAFAAIEHPGLFGVAVCQSPSAWWKEEQILRELKTTPPPRGRFWISVGSQETETDADHPPSDMRQTTSQMDSSRRLAEALQEQGAPVEFSVFNGGHDIGCWHRELPDALRWAVKDA